MSYGIMNIVNNCIFCHNQLYHIGIVDAQWASDNLISQIGIVWVDKSCYAILLGINMTDKIWDNVFSVGMNLFHHIRR